VAQASTEDPLAEFHEPAVDLSSEDERAGAGRLVEYWLDLGDGRRDRPRGIHARASEVVRRVGGQVIRDEASEVAANPEVLASGAPETFEQSLGGSVEPDDMTALVEPSAQTWVGDDAIGSDHAAEARPGVRLVRPPQAGCRVDSPGWFAGQIDEAGTVTLGKRSTDGQAAASRSSNEDRFHRLNYAALDPRASLSIGCPQSPWG